jgi:hypothetical protein
MTKQDKLRIYNHIWNIMKIDHPKKFRTPTYKRVIAAKCFRGIFPLIRAISAVGIMSNERIMGMIENSTKKVAEEAMEMNEHGYVPHPKRNYVKDVILQRTMDSVPEAQRTEELRNFMDKKLDDVIDKYVLIIIEKERIGIPTDVAVEEVLAGVKVSAQVFKSDPDLTSIPDQQLN